MNRMNEADERLIERATAYIEDLFQGNAGGHDAAHTLRVWRNARLIAEGEPDCDLLIVSLAALLHDVDDHKLFQTENNRNVRAFLEEHSVEPDVIDQICGIINVLGCSANSCSSSTIICSDSLEAVPLPTEISVTLYFRISFVIFPTFRSWKMTAG